MNRFLTLVVVSVFVLAGTGVSFAQERGATKPDPAIESIEGTGSITDGGTSFSYDSFSGTSAPIASFNVPGGTFGTDFVFAYGWYWRVEGDGSETPFPAPDSSNYSGNTATLDWTGLGGAFDATETTVVTEVGPTQATLETTLVVTNTSGSTQTLNLYHYADVEGGGDSFFDSAVLSRSPDVITISDADVSQYRGGGNDAFQVTAFSALVSALNDGAVTDFDNSGLPFSGDFTGGYQWTDLSVADGASVTIGVSLSVNAAAPGPAGGSEQSRANFAVNKIFDDGNPAEVEVTISCNTGLPLEQTTTIDQDSGVVFVVTDFNDGELDCEITEAPVAGYTPTYNAFGVTSAESCVHEGVGFGDVNQCLIVNSLNAVVFEVTKEWIDENPQFNAVNFAEATYFCVGAQFSNPAGSLDFFGNPGFASFQVFPHWDNGTFCTVTESVVEGGVEVDNSDCQGVSVVVGGGASCTIVNTRLYEGIPTLSQYGLAVLALLMLGVGFVAFRRMA